MSFISVPAGSSVVLPNSFNGFVLSLDETNPYPTTDQIGKNTIYAFSVAGEFITIWNGSEWVSLQIDSPPSLVLSDLTNGVVYDVFAVISGSTFAYSLSAWASTSARNVAVALSDGVWVDATNKSRLLLATFTATSATTTESSSAKRHFCNVYNTRPVNNFKSEAGGAYDGALRNWNNNNDSLLEWTLALPQNIFIEATCTFSIFGTAFGDLQIAPRINGVAPAGDGAAYAYVVGATMNLGSTIDYYFQFSCRAGFSNSYVTQSGNGAGAIYDGFRSYTYLNQ